jgi:hypothetical protein
VDVCTVFSPRHIKNQVGEAQTRYRWTKKRCVNVNLEKFPFKCGKSYIEEARRTLETPLSEHKRTVSKGDPQHIKTNRTC